MNDARTASGPSRTARLLLAAILLATASGQAATLSGRVVDGATPLPSLGVALYATDPGRPLQCASILGAATTATDGGFAITFTPPTDADTVLYVIADGGSVDPSGKFPRAGKCQRWKGPVVLASILGTVGTAPIPTDVVVNGRTTVAAAYALAQFIDRGRIAGKSPGIQNAAGMSANLADATTGDVASVLASAPNGSATETLGSFNALANMVAACIAVPASCATLFEQATPPRGPTPTDTLQALVDLARNPATSTTAVQALFTLSKAPPAPYQPARDPGSPPAAWTLALLFEGDGMSLDGPGNFAIGPDGSLWVPNNYVYSADPNATVCGGKLLMHFTPTGQYVEGSPYQGGGINGAGFGATFDPDGHVWIGNFGFGSPSCSEPSPANSVSKFTQGGVPLSTDTGYTEGGVDWPQGMASDLEGSIWIANCANGIVTKYPQGDHTAAQQFVADPVCGTTNQCSRPFDLAFNKKGWAFVTLNDRDAVAVLRPDGTPTAHSPLEGVFDQPLGIAADSRGNMWVSNSASLRVPCPQGFLTPASTDGSIVMIDKRGRITKGPFVGGGLTIPWGIAVDGDDNVWVANFYDRRLSHFCGRKRKTCPPGADTGTPISPDGGYAFDGLTRNTGVAIDPSGNVWLTNNWLNEPNPIGNPGGHAIVAFVGMAPPLRAPLIGTPQRP